MNILIVGLGLMGASYAKGLLLKNHKVYGVDINEETINYAKEFNIVTDASTSVLDFIDKVELIILGLYPNDILPFLAKYQPYFTKNHLITDICGIKRFFLTKVSKYLNEARYMSHHPMAGREKIGIKNSDNNIFKKMNFLICYSEEKSDSYLDDVQTLKTIGEDLEFKNISVVDAKKHDEMISFTSQLTHLLAVSLVNSDKSDDTKYYIGDSYKDLTRIAMINEKLWSQLFFNNKDLLIEKVDNFLGEINKIKEALQNDDYDTLENLFKRSTMKRKELE